MTDASGSASRIVSAADAPAMPSPMITCDVLMYGRYEIGLNVDCYLRIVSDSEVNTAEDTDSRGFEGAGAHTRE
ncbi:hypothetical protein GCM10009067_22170 [Haloarcula sebkhae]|uniref:Uncharacterized protein n=1 Tax=Haloarcula sebkhae TaxID=932660 RepID=A0A830F0D8_9EURY|nr:hypothetical protein GCM10009067_22170 [Haloarcula sebkhae]